MTSFKNNLIIIMIIITENISDVLSGIFLTFIRGVPLNSERNGRRENRRTAKMKAEKKRRNKQMYY